MGAEGGGEKVGRRITRVGEFWVKKRREETAAVMVGEGKVVAEGEVVAKGEAVGELGGSIQVIMRGKRVLKTR